MWRAGAALAATLGLALTLAPARARSAAGASAEPLCDGYAACSTAGFTTHGYQNVAATSYWRMYAGDDCTNYAAYVESTVYGAPTPGYLLGNAGEWAVNAAAHGVEVNGVPAVGAVAEWNGGDPGMGLDGHVAVVEEVGPDDSYIVISQQDIGSDTNGYEWRRIEAGTPAGSWEPWPDNFIHFTGSVGSGGTAAGAEGEIAPAGGLAGAVAALPEAPVESAPASGAVTEGSFVSVEGTVYLMVGGAPLYVSSWGAVGGAQPTIAMTAAQLAALPAHPRNGTLLETPEGRLYRVAGGAALSVARGGQLGGAEVPTVIDPWDIQNAGSPLSHLRAAPANGTLVEGLPSRKYWSFQGARRRQVKPRAGAIAVADTALRTYPQMRRAAELEARSAELKRERSRAASRRASSADRRSTGGAHPPRG